MTEKDLATLFGPKRIKACAIDWDQIHADFHQGARRQSRILDAVYMAAADQMSKLNNPLATQEPSIHGPSDNGDASASISRRPDRRARCNARSKPRSFQSS